MRQSQQAVVWIAVLAITVVFFTTSARAQGGSMAGAEALLAEGNRLFDKKDYPAALVKFQQAHQLQQDPSILVNLGLTLEKLDRLPEAAARFEQFLEEADVKADARQIKGIRPKLDALRKKLGSFTLVCEVGGAAVIIDGKPAGTTPLGHRLYVTPGRHEVTVIGAGNQPFKEELVLLPGEHQKITATLVSSSGSASEPGTKVVDLTPAPPLKSRPSPFYKKWWFWTAVGVAVVGGSVAIGLELSRDKRVPGDPIIGSEKFTLGASF